MTGVETLKVANNALDEIAHAKDLAFAVNCALENKSDDRSNAMMACCSEIIGPSKGQRQASMVYRTPFVGRTTMQPDPQPLDLLWGCKDIGKVCGLTEGQAKYMLVNGELPGRKVGGRWVASREALRLFFVDRERAA